MRIYDKKDILLIERCEIDGYKTNKTKITKQGI